jgi:hypothetical protein
MQQPAATYGELITFMSDITIDDSKMEDLYAAFRFQGYDPIVTFNHLVKRAQEKGFSTAQFKTDMTTLCTWFVMRGAKIPVSDAADKGPNQGRSIEKTSQEGKDKIRKIKTDYNIINRTPQTDADINLARVIGCFPHVVAALMKKYPGIVRLVIPADKDKNSYAPLPPYLLFPQGISLIPQNQEYNEWVSKFKLWSIDFDQIVNRGKQTAADRLETYVEATYRSKLFSDEQRRKIIKDLSDLKPKQLSFNGNASNVKP